MWCEATPPCFCEMAAYLQEVDDAKVEHDFLAAGGPLSQKGCGAQLGLREGHGRRAGPQSRLVCAVQAAQPSAAPPAQG